jgi:hypothetical protein
MFIAALFLRTKVWKQPGCPKTHEWMNKFWHIYTMKCYSVIRKNAIMFAENGWNGSSSY